MQSEESYGIQLLDDLESILEQDPLIDEIGFLHPSQIPTAEAFDNDVKHAETASVSWHFKSEFWISNHKLGISSAILVPLYQAAKCAFLASSGNYRSLTSCENKGECLVSAEADLMKHSKALVLLCSGYASAWNSRRQVILQKPIKEVYSSELRLSELVLSYALKCEQAWSYRRWVIKLIMNAGLGLEETVPVLERESELVEQIAERSPMNYRAWRHRAWLVQYMSSSLAVVELNKAKKWAESHVGDNCCFHYCRCLLLRLQQLKSESDTDKADELSKSDNSCQGRVGEISGKLFSWRKELDWNKDLIQRYMDREALWIHRRFLFHKMVEEFSENEACWEHCSTMVDFLEGECNLINLCIDSPVSAFNDFMKQREHPAMYKMWMIVQLHRRKKWPDQRARLTMEANKLADMLDNIDSRRAFVFRDLSKI